MIEGSQTPGPWKDLREACQNLTATVEELFEGLEIVATVPAHLREAVEAAKAAIAKAE